MPAANPVPYNPSFDFSAFQAANPGVAYPAADFDTEFSAISGATDGLVAAMADIRASDGGMVNGIVDYDALDPATVRPLMGGWTPRGPWITARSYSAKDLVSGPDGQNYVAVVAHVSGASFIADGLDGKWQSVIGNGLASADLAVVTATGSATGATLASRFARELWVEDFGAKGDGSNDYPAIQAGITYAEATGLTLRFGPKNYRLDQPLVITQRALILQGTGKASFLAVSQGTRLSFAGSLTANWIDVQGGDNTIFRDLEIRAATGIIPTAGYAVSIQRSVGSISGTRCSMENVRIFGCWNGVLVHGSPAARLIDVYVDYVGDVGIHYFGNADYRTDNLYLERCTTAPSLSTADGFRMEGDCASLFAHNCYWRGGRYGARVRAAGGFTPVFACFRNCAAEVCASHGYYLEAVKICILDTCYSSINTGDGIHVAVGCLGFIQIRACDTRGNGTHGVHVEACPARVGVRDLQSCSNSQTTPNTSHGLLFDANCDGFQVIGGWYGGDINGIITNPNPQRNGITITVGCVNYIVAMCDVRGNTNVGLYDGGAGDTGRVFAIIGYRSKAIGQAFTVTPDANGLVPITHGVDAAPIVAFVGLLGDTPTRGVEVQALSTTTLTVRIFNQADGADVTSGTFNVMWSVSGYRGSD